MNIIIFEDQLVNDLSPFYSDYFIEAIFSDDNKQKNKETKKQRNKETKKHVS